MQDREERIIEKRGTFKYERVNVAIGHEFTRNTLRYERGRTRVLKRKRRRK